jgi:hypothetical protein
MIDNKSEAATLPQLKPLLLAACLCWPAWLWLRATVQAPAS